MQKYLIILLFIFSAIPLQADITGLLWQAGLIDPPQYPAPMGFYIYCADNDNICKDDPSTYIEKIDVGVPNQIILNGEHYYKVDVQWCNIYRCYAVSAYIVYGQSPHQITVESALSQIICRYFGRCISW